MRVLLAGIIGGLVFFVCGFVSHVILPLGQVGISTLDNEQVVLDSMRNNIREPGFYFFPGMDMSKSPSAEEQEAWAQKYKSGPNGVLVYHPTGNEPMAARTLLSELASNIAACLLAAFILSWLPSFGKRVAAAALFGIISWISISFSYWNWYGFPGSYVTAELTDQFASWLLSGIVIALILKGNGLRRRKYDARTLPS